MTVYSSTQQRRGAGVVAAPLWLLALDVLEVGAAQTEIELLAVAAIELVVEQAVEERDCRRRS